jgi:hypothetical protein
MGGGVRTTTSGVLNTVSPSQLRPPDNASCQKAKAIGRQPAGKETSQRTANTLAVQRKLIPRGVRVLWRAVDANRPMQPRCDRAAALVPPARNVTSESTSPHALLRANGSARNLKNDNKCPHHRFVIPASPHRFEPPFHCAWKNFNTIRRGPTLHDSNGRTEARGCLSTREVLIPFCQYCHAYRLDRP